MSRFFFLGGLAILALLLALAVPGLLIVRVTAPIRAGVRLGGVEVLQDGFVSAFLLEIGDGEVALIDAGNDPDARVIRAALARRGLGPEAIRAILLTHGDPDHRAGAAALSAAPVMALEPDVALAEGRENRGVMRILPARPTGIRVRQALQDGDVLQLAGVPVRVLAVPGHSRGSTAYLASGVLFLGDTCVATKDGRLEPGWSFTTPTARPTRPRSAGSRRGWGRRPRPCGPSPVRTPDSSSAASRRCWSGPAGADAGFSPLRRPGRTPSAAGERARRAAGAGVRRPRLHRARCTRSLPGPRACRRRGW